MKFYLGTHMDGWLSELDVPLFVSHRRLMKRKRLPVARTGWALDSGGFTELSMHGRWITTPQEYVAAVRRYQDEIGQLDWVAPQDWMCEPWIIAKTGKTVAYHQARTIESFCSLRSGLGSLVVPVLQGFTLGEYLSHADQYSSAGVDLTVEHTVGIGSVCRRQSGNEIAGIVTRLADEGIALHGFGMKTEGLRRVGCRLASADSMAWSYAARNRPVRLEGHDHKTCSNCAVWAMQWRDDLLAAVGQREVQGVLL